MPIRGTSLIYTPGMSQEERARELAEYNHRMKSRASQRVILPKGQFLTVLSKDGRDSEEVGSWMPDGPNAPIFVRGFVEYDGMPFVLADSERGFPDVWRMRPSGTSKRGYMLEETSGSIIPDALFKSFPITEEEAVELL